ncbi:hypothetical protein D3C72_1569300 [compost metagenome]
MTRGITALSAITLSTATQSPTVRAIAQAVSSVYDSGNAPVSGTRRAVGLKPVMPHSAAGMRMEPPVSLPSAATASPSATETAAPDDEPPGMRATPSVPAGLAGVP